MVDKNPITILNMQDGITVKDLIDVLSKILSKYGNLNVSTRDSYGDEALVECLEIRSPYALDFEMLKDKPNHFVLKDRLMIM